MAEYRGLLEKQGIGVNAAILVGHNTLRRSIVGYDNRPASSDEFSLMKRQLEESLEAGALGLSTGLVYAPGMFAPREEIIELARIVARYEGLYGSHMRSEGDALLEAMDEAMSIGREAGTRVQVSHLKVSGRTNWHKIDDALDQGVGDTLIHRSVAPGQVAGLRLAALSLESLSELDEAVYQFRVRHTRRVP